MLSEIQKTGLNTIFRICIFLLYYIALICIGAAILYGASFATRYIMSDVIDARPTDLSYKLLIIAGLIIMWVTVGLFGFYLIKPLFSFRSNKEHKTEVFRNECPELFAAIDDVAEKTGAKKPKHVYLSPGTNACVFFNRSFWSIFFPVRKNLEIGLGLFNSTSIVELKAIMAHEFGHFSQRSMRIVSSIYITNSIIAEMIDNDAWDNMIYKWRKSKWDLLCLTGNLVYWMTYYIQKLTFQMYKFVQKEYLKLSRNMEYNADTIAANSIGKKAFISSLYKVEIISVIDDFYNNILRHMISKNEIVANYETGYKIVEQRIKEYENYDFSEKKFITEDYKHECPSKIKLEQIWSTHPSLDDRVINIERAKGCKTNELDKRPSLLLVNENIRQKIYADKLNSIIEESDAAPATIDNNTFDKFIYDTLFSKKISRQMLPFFDRNIISFDPDDNYNIPKQNPFNKKNTYAIKEFFRAYDDYVLLIDFRDGRIAKKEILYDGNIYDRKNVPVQKHEEYLEKLRSGVAVIDKDIYAYIMSNSGDKETIKFFYREIFKLEALTSNQFRDLQKNRETFVNYYNGEWGQNTMNTLIAEAVNYDKTLRDTIYQIDLSDKSDLINKDDLDKINGYLNSDSHPVYSLNIDIVNNMFAAYDTVFGTVLELDEILRKKLSIIAEDMIKK